MSIVKRVQEYLSTGATTSRDQSSRGPSPDDSPESADVTPPGGPQEATVDRPEPSSRLYRCDACDVTYISETMTECSRCGTAVETTPTEHDLGLV
jgi:hypothetical protein